MSIPPTGANRIEAGLEAPLPPLGRRLLSGGIWAFGGKGLTALATLAVNALLARLLAPAEMGAYFLTFGLVSALAVAAKLGMELAVVRLVAESMALGKPGRARLAVRTAFLFCVIGGLAAAAVLLLGFGRWLATRVFESPAMAAVIGLAALWVIALSLESFLAESFRGFHDIRLASTFNGLVTAVLSALLFGFLWVVQGHSNLREVLVLSVSAGTTNVLIAGFLLRRRLTSVRGQGTLRNQEVLSLAFPLLLMNLFLFAFTQADLLILGAFRPQQEVALYGAAARLVALVSVPLSIVNAVVSPMIAELYGQGEKKKLEQALRSTTTLAAIPAVVAVLACVFAGRQILGLVYGDFYAEGALVLAVLALGQLVNVWSGSCGLLVAMTGHQNAATIIVAISATVSITIALLTVNQLGALGVGIARASGLILQNVTLIIYGYRVIGIKAYGTLSPRMLRR
jgi:O-antigen/teichoic acid export membrane protein